MSTRKGDLVRFGVFSAATFALLFWLQIRWLGVAAWLMGRDRIVFDEQPDWLRILKTAVDAIPWLIDGNLALFSIIVAEVWSSTSVFAILILAGLFAMPQEPVEAAKVDGCTSWQTFRYVTWPFLMPFAFIAMTIRSLDVARAYDIVKIMTDGGPARRTELIWTLVGRTAYADAQMGLANAMAYVSIILSIAFTVYFFRKLALARTQIGAEW